MLKYWKNEEQLPLKGSKSTLKKSKCRSQVNKQAVCVLSYNVRHLVKVEIYG